MRCRMLFEDLVTKEEMKNFLLENQRDRRRVYTPEVTLHAFLSQVAARGGSCQTAVNEVHVKESPKHESRLSLNTSSYTRARQKLSLDGLMELTKSVSKSARELMQPEWGWKGKDVYLIDGSTVSMADSTKNVERFPKRRNQNEYNGYPLARVMLATSLATGTVQEFKLAPFKGKGTGELSLASDLIKNLEKGGTIVADAMFVSYAFMAKCKLLNLNFVAQKKDNRKYKILSKQTIGSGDKIIYIKKPRKPLTEWVGEVDYESLPSVLVMRETNISLDRPGYRTKNICILSTFIDPSEVSSSDLAELYQKRWNIELDLRVIKQELSLNFLACKSPEMIEKEAWMNLLAFNLTRRLMGKVAQNSGVSPRSLSFKGILQFYIRNNGRNAIAAANGTAKSFIELLSAFRLKKQPHRFEPRAKKTNAAQSVFPTLCMTRNRWKALQLMSFLEGIELSTALTEGIEREKSKIPTKDGRVLY